MQKNKKINNWSTHGQPSYKLWPHAVDNSGASGNSCSPPEGAHCYEKYFLFILLPSIYFKLDRVPIDGCGPLWWKLQVEKELDIDEQFEELYCEEQYNRYYMGVTNIMDELHKHSERCFKCAKDVQC